MTAIAGPTMPGGGPSAGPPAAPYPAAPGYSPYAYGPSPLEAERRKQIDRTKTGVLILLIGSLIGWIPIIGALGGLLTLIGAILVILGRKAFGRTHRRNVVISIVLFFVGILIAIAGVLAGVFAAVGALSSSMTEPQLTVALQNAFTNILIIAAVGTLVSGLASVFFTYVLQKREGQLVLWAAYAATIGIEVAIIIVAIPVLNAAAATIAHQFVTTGTVNSVEISNAVSGATSGLELLNVIPGLLYAAANYLAWSRINRGEIPPATTPPGMPMGMTGPSPPAPPINPR